MKVAHLTSVHPRYDTRIFLKECRSLAAGGASVTLIVADGLGDECRDNVQILDVGKFDARLDRMRKAPGQILRKAVEQNADLYHLHDPELLPLVSKLKKLNKKVIFDAHEDVPKQILSKPYISKPMRLIASSAFAIYEKWVLPKVDVVIGATPFIRDKYLAMGIRSVDINNFPLLGELSFGNSNWVNKKNFVAYVGGITRIRGIVEVVKALGIQSSSAKLQLVGKFSEPGLESEVIQQPGWQFVDALGFLGRSEVAEVLAHSVAGLVTFLPAPNHVDAQPNKMFEYMSAGIPVIASNFPLWRDIVEGNSCGICVNPEDPVEIAAAIDQLISNPEMAEQLGLNGKKAVENKYNWSLEEKKLLNLYDSLADLN